MLHAQPLARGLWGALVTPFTEEDAADVDDAGLRRQVELHQCAGSARSVVLRVYGEGARPSATAQDHVVRTVTAEATGLPVVVGLSALDTPGAVAAAQRRAGVL
jgi:4-hydroxy-tetrahydrodipicolinate synthase